MLNPGRFYDGFPSRGRRVDGSFPSTHHHVPRRQRIAPIRRVDLPSIADLRTGVHHEPTLTPKTKPIQLRRLDGSRSVVARFAQRDVVSAARAEQNPKCEGSIR
jgi:hypothetical protein